MIMTVPTRILDYSFALVAFIFYIQNICSIYASTPMGEMHFEGYSDFVYIQPGSYGNSLDSKSSATYRYLLQPIQQDGCNPVLSQTVDSYAKENFYLLVARGNCSFDEKSLAASKIGAKGIVVYNNEESIYDGLKYANETDYECSSGSGYVNNADIVFPIYGDDMISKMPSSCTQNDKCSSKRCLLTSNSSQFTSQVCCAWDYYITMGGGTDSDIVAVFITMSAADQVKSIISTASDQGGYIKIAMFSRYLGNIDFSSFILWCIAISVIVVSAMRTVKEESNEQFESFNRYFSKVSNQEHQRKVSSLTNPNLSSYQSSESILRIEKVKMANSNFNVSGSPTEMEVSPFVAFLFILCSSLFLITLYYVNLYLVVVFIYLLVSSFALQEIIFLPACKYISKQFDLKDLDDGSSSHANLCQIFAYCLSLSVCVLWYLHKSQSWSFILQDIMGSAVCILFLSSVRLPDLKTATLLLSLAFSYDVFFVFISPYIFGGSVMLKVASGGSSSSTHGDPNFCDKYPTNSDCQTSTLPMMLMMPAWDSYLSIDSILGLGDVILPGLLLVWAARCDLRQFSSSSTFWRRRNGFFIMAMVGYLVGLLLADCAVLLFQTGQPALFYIVPLTLIPILIKAKLQGNFADLWVKLPEFERISLEYMEEEEGLLPDAYVNTDSPHSYVIQSEG